MAKIASGIEADGRNWSIFSKEGKWYLSTFTEVTKEEAEKVMEEARKRASLRDEIEKQRLYLKELEEQAFAGIL